MIASGVYPMYLRGDYDTAVFQAFKEVEISVRNAARLGYDRLGCPLMRDAFNPKTGPLSDAQEFRESNPRWSCSRGRSGISKIREATGRWS